MIQLTELRIGNLLEYNIASHNETPEWVDNIIDWEDIKNCVEDNKAFNKYHRPIPLTEELLLRLGGIKNDRASYPSYNVKGLLIDFIKGKWIEYVSQIEITSLHHLQNVVYFRTNQELKLEI